MSVTVNITDTMGSSTIAITDAMGTTTVAITDGQLIDEDALVDADGQYLADADGNQILTQ